MNKLQQEGHTLHIATCLMAMIDRHIADSTQLCICNVLSRFLGTAVVVLLKAATAGKEAGTAPSNLAKAAAPSKCVMLVKLTLSKLEEAELACQHAAAVPKQAHQTAGLGSA